MLETWIFLAVSIFFLYKCSNIVVDKAVILARFFGISQLAIGFLLISVSTSLPELAVGISSSVAHEGGIMLGNVFGSNIADILLVVGLGAFLFGIRISASQRNEVGFIIMLTTAISAYVLFTAVVSNPHLGRAEGVILLLAFAAYSYYVMAKRKAEDMDGIAMPSKHESMVAFMWFFAAVIGVILSAGLAVDSAVILANGLGIAKSFIGATIVAIGTSLPELSIDLAALKKRRYGLAIGDAIGSTITNLTLVLGAGAAIFPVALQSHVYIATFAFAIIANILLYHFAQDRKISKKEGAAMLAAYALFIIVIFWLQAEELLLPHAA